jgi:tetratricopeptide (TPR) repeat protein
MFFPRLRNHAKWMFVFLAAVFAIGFVGFGVGSGSTGVGDILRGNFHLFGSGKSPAAKAEDKARARLAKHPDDAKAWSDLAAALTQQNKAAAANRAWEHYVKLRPKAADAYLRIASYWQTKANNLSLKARAEQAEQPPGVGPTGIVTPSGPLAQAFGQDPISQQFQQQASKDFQNAFAAYQKSEKSYKRVTQLQSDNQNAWFQLGEVALQLGDVKTAKAAYTKAIKIAPDDAIAQLAKQRLQLLASQPSATSASG